MSETIQAASAVTKAVRKSKFTLEQTTPIVELPVRTVSPSGKVSEMFVGYKRFPTEKAQELIKQWTEMEKPILDLENQKRNGDTVSELLFTETAKSVRENVNIFLREHIVYMRRVQLESETGKGPLVTDTRIYDDASLWDGWDNCLDFLLDLALDWNIWREALISGAYTALINKETRKDAEAKN
jgi:hypothetical protein